MPTSTRRPRSSPAVSCGPIATRCDAYTGPVSRPASSCITQTPVSVSPARIARSTGAAPRQRGSSEKCTLTKPERQRFEQRHREELTERDDDTELGARRAHVVDDLTRLHRRAHREPELLGRDAHRRRIAPRAARPAPIGLRDDQRDVVTGVDQRAEGWDRVGSECPDRRVAPGPSPASDVIGRGADRPASAHPSPARAARASPLCAATASSRSSISTPSR